MTTKTRTKKAATAKVTGRHYTRRFSEPGDPFAGIKWTYRDAVVSKQGGAEVFRMNDVEAPDFWSDLAVRICASKYFALKYESSIRNMIEGVADSLALSGLRQGYFDGPASANAFRDDIAWLIVHQYATFNSPVWFNVRLFDSYGMTGSGGNWAYNFATGKYEKQKTAYERPQGSACFILPLKDNLVGPQGIAQSIFAETKIFRGGSGSGINYGRLREKNGPISSGKTSSGMMSFLKTFDTNAGSMKSGGTTRRAARMACVDVDHPDILAFIRWKAREEKKAQALIAAGFAGEMEGEAYETVSGQNANNSIRVTDRFMEAVVADEPWELKSRVGGTVTSTLPARQIWREIAQAAWECGDPGVQYDDTINGMHTCAATDRIYASNPCSEFMFLDNSACNLASLRLTKFFDGHSFDVKGFQDTCHTFLLAMDILVDYASYPTKGLAKGSHEYRPLGLGYADLGTLLGQLGLAYDSDAGRAVAGAITSLLTGTAYDESADIAAERGPFPAWAANETSALNVLDKHRASHEGLVRAYLSDDAWSKSMTDVARRALSDIAREGSFAWDQVHLKARRHGVRNAQATLLAPTGTIGFKLDTATTGVEPQLGHVQIKKLAGGGEERLVNPSIRETLRLLGYTLDEANVIEAYIQAHGNVSAATPGFRPEHISIFDTALPCGPDKRVIRADAHVLMMAAVQPFLSGAISKTVNLPADATVEDVERVYMEGWRLGLKAVALYRDGCKQSQPVSVEKTSIAGAAESLDAAAKGLQEAAQALASASEGGSLSDILASPAKVAEALKPGTLAFGGQRKLPPVRPGITWEATLDGHKIFIRSGEYPDGTIGEVFLDMAKEGSTLGGMMGMWAQNFSLSLQYGVPLSRLVDTYLHTQFEPSGHVSQHPTIRRSSSLVDLVVRVLGVHYLKRTDLQHIQPEDVVPDASLLYAPVPAAPAPAAPSTASYGKPCPVCGHIAMPNGNCHRCANCGESLGCS